MSGTTIGRPAGARKQPGPSAYPSPLGAPPGRRQEAARDARFPFSPSASPPAALAPAPAAAPGLVTYAITGRDAAPDYPPTVRDIWSPQFPRADLVAVAAGQFAPLAALGR